MRQRIAGHASPLARRAAARKPKFSNAYSPGHFLHRLSSALDHIVPESKSQSHYHNQLGLEQAGRKNDLTLSQLANADVGSAKRNAARRALRKRKR